MISSDWIGKGLIIWSCFILLSPTDIVDGQLNKKCFTEDNTSGVCVPKRYCREAHNHRLIDCDRGLTCCPIPTTLRSAQSGFNPQEHSEYNVASTRKPSANDRNNPSSGRYAPRESDASRPSDDTRQSSSPRKPVVNNEKYPIKEDRPLYERNLSKEYGEDRKPSLYGPTVQNRDQPSEETGYQREPFETYDRPSRQPSSGQRDNERRTYDKPRVGSNGRVKFGDEIQRPSSYPTQVRGEDRRTSGTRDDESFMKRPRYPSESGTRVISTTKEDSYPVPKTPVHYPSRDRINPHDRARPTQSSRRDGGSSVPKDAKVPECGVKPYDLFIAGGEASEPHEWPWMVAIFRRFQNSMPKVYVCGGTLLNTRYVLTAAHCFVNNYVVLPASSFVIRLGSHYLKKGEDYTVSELTIHHNHSGSDHFNDIALVRLAAEVFVTDKIAPICLPTSDMMSQSFEGKIATVAGWGDTEYRTGGYPVLQHVSIPVVSNEDCIAAYSRVQGAAFMARGSNHIICAGLKEGGKDACLGDSGGPLMLKEANRWVVVGIVSLGFKCAEPGYPGVYTRVTHYVSWIYDNMKRF